jgi:hypothetical protein
MPTLPNGFKPTVATYSFDGPGGVMRTEVAGGAPRYGMAYDRGAQRYSVTLMLDKLKFSIWVAFYHHIIKKGAITFDMPLDSGFGTDTHAVNIVPGSYSATRTGGIVTVVTFTVEAESNVYDITAADASSLIDLYNSAGAGADALLEQIEQFANIDSNVLDFA